MLEFEFLECAYRWHHDICDHHADQYQAIPYRKGSQVIMVMVWAHDIRLSD